MSGVYLFIWTVVAMHGSQYGSVTVREREWQNQGKFSAADVCHTAAKNLNLKKEHYRCITSHTGEVK